MMTQGRYKMLVNPISSLEMPIRLYMITDTVLTMMYGMPSAKYKVGTKIHGVLFRLDVRLCPLAMLGSARVSVRIAGWDYFVLAGI